MSRYRCIRFENSEQEDAIEGSFSIEEYAKWAKNKSSRRPRILLVLPENNFKQFVLDKTVRGLTYMVQGQAGGAPLKDRLLGKSKPVALRVKYKVLGNLSRAIFNFLGHAEEDDNERNVYVLGTKDDFFKNLPEAVVKYWKKRKQGGHKNKTSRRPAGTERMSSNPKHDASPKVTISGKSPRIEVPDELRERFWGDSDEAEEVRKAIMKAAQIVRFEKMNVLIQGPSGSGKEVVARAIHDFGRGTKNKSGYDSFIPVDCATFSSELLETELYGSKKGAATDVEEHTGLWELAHNCRGTLFLDEIGNMSKKHQKKVLRALEERKIRRAGDNQPRDVDNARVIAATNCDLESMIKTGEFREDLYYRLRQIPIIVPSLRPEDVKKFALRYWKKGSRSPAKTLSPEILKWLKSHPWPGNVRELQNFLDGLDFDRYEYPTIELADVIAYDLRARSESAPFLLPREDSDTRSQPEPEPEKKPEKADAAAPSDLVMDRARKFEKDRSRYEALTEILRSILEKTVKTHAPLAIIQSRTKSVARFTEKLLHLSMEKSSFDDEPSDLSGIRVILYTKEQVQSLASFLEQRFRVDRKHSFPFDRPKAMGSVHQQPVIYVISLDRDSADEVTALTGISIPDEVLNTKAEVQLRTVLEHTVAHFRSELRRDHLSLAAARLDKELEGLQVLLQAVDKAFSRIHQGMETPYAKENKYLDDLNRDEIQKEIGILEMVRQSQPDDVGVGARIARMAIALGDWDRAIHVLEPFRESGSASVLRDLGVAICQKHRTETDSVEYRRGQRYLKDACNGPFEDLDACASLGGTYKRQGELEKARNSYERALLIDPADSYPLNNYLELEMKLNPEHDVVAERKKQIEAAVERCLANADAGVNIPWTFYDLGKMYLFLEEPVQSFPAYANAIRWSTSRHMIQTSLESLESIYGIKPSASVDMMGQMLRLGIAAQFGIGDDNIEIMRKGWPPKHDIREPVLLFAGDPGAFAEKDTDLFARIASKALQGFSCSVVCLFPQHALDSSLEQLRHLVPDSIDLISYGGNEALFEQADGEPAGAEKDREIQTGIYTALEAWTDILLSGIQPQQVRSLGFGPTAGWKAVRTLAFAFEASMGVLRTEKEEQEVLSQEGFYGESEISVLYPEATALQRYIMGGAIDRG